MKIYFDKLYKDDRKDELCGICVPLAKGALTEDKTGTVKVIDGDKELPVQLQVTSTWEDGSVRYLYVYFLADLPGNNKKELILTYDGEDDNYRVTVKKREEPFTACPPIEIEEGGDVFYVKNGILEFSLRNGADSLFEKFECAGKSFSKDQFVGPFVTYKSERLRTVFDEWRIKKRGKLFSCIEGKGRCLSDRDDTFTGEGIRFEIRLSVTAGKPWIDTGFKLINCTEGDIRPDEIIFAIKSSLGADISFDTPLFQGISVDSTGCGDTKKTAVAGDVVTTTGTSGLPEFDIKKPADEAGIRSIVGRSNYKTEFKISRQGDRVENMILAESLLWEGNEHFSEVFYGTFFADFTDAANDTGVCATVFQAFQNYPKAVRSDRNGIVVYLIPNQNDNAPNTASAPVVFTSGMAREQRFLLHFHSADETIYELENRSLIYQMPDRPYIDPMEFSKAGVMPDIFLPVEKQIDDVEISLIESADSHARCLGMLCFGDAPDPNYTEQGRGGGDLVWTNNEYDYPHAMYMMYARSGIRRFFDYGYASACHWMDVDVCHYSKNPLRMGGQWEHTRKHTGGSEEGKGCKGEMVCSHEWVEGLLDLYHFTADERALETAIGIGENVLRLLETPMYQIPGESNARETGWALRTLTALYIETHDKKWVGRCEWIIDQFKAWNDRYGNWLAPYTDNTTIRVGFMISVAVGSLMRYYRAFPDEELKSLILGAIDDLTDNFMTPQGLFIYKELPSLSRNGNNTLLLEAMAIGYELTGDERYLCFGEKTFKRTLSASASYAGKKRIAEDCVIVGSGPTKAFAQSFLPRTTFYVKLVKSR